ncbi:MAG: hypothetical protein MJ057_03995 [Sphaerochaetaceae bacterium]|nr:hypothetical protein [Sphaerochaetaceae bacterium]
MKKITVALISVLVVLLLASCATMGKAKNVIHVTTFDELTAAFKAAKADPEKDTVMLDNDIAWDAIQYAGDAYVFNADATGLTFDLNGYAITGVPKNAFNLTGDSFTIKNGSILAAEGNNRYSININYDGTNGIKELALPKVPGAYDDSDPVWAKRVVVENLTATGMLIGYSTAEVKNSQFIGGTYRGLVFQGSSGIVENVTVACADGAGSAGFVAHSYGVVTVKGECNFASKFGIYTAFCGKCIIDPAAKVTVRAYETVGIYAETQGTSEIYGTIDITPAPSKKAYIVRTGASSTIEKGAKFIVNGAEPAVGAIVAEDGNAYVDFKTGAGDKDKNYEGYGVDGFITDLR